MATLEFVELIYSNNSLFQRFFLSHTFCLKNGIIKFESHFLKLKRKIYIFVRNCVRQNL